jgi:hypothetical protein
MKFWRFSDPSDYRYARAVRHGGTWQEGEPWRRAKPLAIVWLPDSDVVGDFTWPGLDTDIVITDRVGIALKQAVVTGFVKLIGKHPNGSEQYEVSGIELGSAANGAGQDAASANRRTRALRAI